MNQEYLKSIMCYNPESGVFVWLSSGKVAGGCYGRYWEIKHKGKNYKAHRLAWLYMTGKFPKFHIDPKDENKINNKWVNLREATPSQNRCNVGIRSNNTTGFKGVSVEKATGKFIAHICLSGKIKHLGTFKMAEAASEAYKNAAIELHGEFANF